MYITLIYLYELYYLQNNIRTSVVNLYNKSKNYLHLLVLIDYFYSSLRYYI